MVENNEVTAKAVAGAELCQHQMHLVHTRRQGRKKERERREDASL